MTGTVLILSILLSIVSDGAYTLIVGTLFAGRWLATLETSAPPAEPAPSYLTDKLVNTQQTFCPANQRRLILICTFLLVLTHLARPWFLAASMSGSTSVRDSLALIPTILSSTHQGPLWYGSSAAILLLLLSHSALSRIPVIALWTCVASLLLIAFAKAATGHAADQGDFTLVEILQAVHILATAVWSGAILISGFLVLPRVSRLRGHAAAWNYSLHLSKSATYALIAVLVSGVYTSDRELDNTLAGLWTSPWGRILIVKIAFVLLALCLGATARFRYLRADSTPNRSTQLVCLLYSEAVVMVVILCLSGILGNNAPPMSNM